MALTRYQILERLRQTPGEVVSGGELAEQLGISRTAVWKNMASLQEEGYQIQTAANKGYRYLGGEVYSGYEVQRRLDTQVVGRELYFLEEIDSTNSYIRQKAQEGAPGGAVAIARKQTVGRGRLARKFESPPNAGVYLTILLRPEISVGELNLVTLLAAVAAADTVAELSGVCPGIKWTNDLFMGGKKICGILTECSVSGENGAVDYAAVGIGMNLLQKEEDFPEELREIAGSVYMGSGVRVSPADYAACLCRNFERYFYQGKFPQNREEIVRKYREKLFFLGQTVQVCGLREQYPAVALDVDGEGRLLVRREDGSIAALNSGEISIRPVKWQQI